MTAHIREARLADASALAACVIEPMTNTFSGRVPAQCLDWLTAEESEANWRVWFRRRERGDNDGQFLLVAETGAGTVAGCALAGPQPDAPAFTGELFLLGVLPSHQGRGFGKRLVGAVARRLATAGIRSLIVRVLRANPNGGFYEHLGADYVRDEPYDWNGVVLPQMVYRWPEITSLLAL